MSADDQSRRVAAVSSAPAPGADAREGGLQRRLVPRQLTMIAIGGAIGVGLFLGSEVTIQLAGPGVILTYLIGAAIALVMAYALAEMAVVHPVAGAFGVYAERYLSRWAGVAVRSTYGFVQIIAIGAEVTAVAIYVRFWFPDVPPWIWVAAVSAGLVAINSAPVSRFGEVEYWFALIKVIAIVAFILGGVALIAGLGPWPAIGLSNLTRHGGFLPHGWTGVWLALTLGITSYMGLEVIAVTAGEADRPRESIPRAMRTMVCRLIGLYVLAIAVVLAIRPWNERGGGGLTGSPFVRAFSAMGIPYAAGLMNGVVISAALSSANTNLYLTTRMLFSLARSGDAPAWLGRLSASGVPRLGLAASTGGMVAAILLAVFAPTRAFLLLYGTAVAGMLFIWIVTLITHLCFRRALTPQQTSDLPIRLRAHPFPSIVAAAALVAIAGTTFVVPGLEYTVIAFAPFLVVISIPYFWRRRAGRFTAAPEDHDG